MWLLREDQRAVDKNVIAKDCFDHIKQRVVRDELVRLAERSVNVVGSGADNTSAAVVRWIGNG